MPVFSYVLISLNSLWYAWLRSGVDRLSSAEKQRGDYTQHANRWPVKAQNGVLDNYIIPIAGTTKSGL